MPSKPIHTKKTDELVTEAAKLHRTVRAALLRLEVIKETLRTEAEKVSERRGNLDQVEFESKAGTATVIFVSESPSIAEGCDPRALRDPLSAEMWASLFREEVKLAPGFSGTFEELPGAVKNQVGAMITWVPNRPRVVLPK